MSGDSAFSINLSNCMIAHTDINNVINSLRELLADLESKAAPLVTTWDGAAQQAYLAKQRQWQADSAELTRILHAINRALEDSIADYRGAERYGVNLFIS